MSDLNEREIQLIRLLAAGLKNQEIADRTGLTLNTVKWYFKQIYSKLHVSNRTQAMAKAQEIALLEDANPKPSPRIATLPARLTSFVGRQHELAQLERLLTDETIRLVTIHGIGGMGKTTLALELARQITSHFPDGIFFVPLMRKGGHLYSHLSRVLAYEGESSLDEVAAYLYEKRTLIILDNFEVFLDDAQELSALLQRTRYLSLLVTSRERLNLQSEFVFPLEGLALKQRSDSDSLQQTVIEHGVSTTITPQSQHSAAYQLFVQRARNTILSFDPDEAEQIHINAICQLLGGMPLAIEIAANWATMLPIQEMYKQLSNNLDLLATNEKDRPQRQQSVRVTFDYSFQLLPTETQTALLGLGVFAPEGFTLAAAQAVANVTPQQLKHLLDHALIQRHDDLFVLHPLIRQYVIEKLDQQHQLKQAVQIAHRTYYFNVVMDYLAKIRDELDMRAATQFITERQNVLQAWWLAIEQERFADLIPLVDMGSLYDLADIWVEADHLFAQTLQAIPQSERILRGRLLTYRVIFTWRANQPEETQRFTQEVEALLSDTPYIRDVAVVLCHSAMVEIVIFNQLDKCIAILDRVDTLLQNAAIEEDAYTKLIVRCARPSALFYARRYEEALPLQEAMPVPVWHEIRILLAETYIHLGYIDQARHILLEQQQVAYQYDNRRLAIGSAFFLALLDTSVDDLPAKVVDTLISAVQDKMDYPAISVFYWALGVLARGQLHWAMLIFNGNIHALYRLGQTFLMYRAILRTAQVLQTFQLEGSNHLLALLVTDPHCPQKIQEQARQQYTQPNAPIDIKHQSLLNAVTQVLLSIVTKQVPP